MKFLINILMLFGMTLGLSIPAFSQSQNKIVDGDITPGFSSKKNYVVNFGAEIPNLTKGVSFTSSILTRTTSDTQIIDGAASFLITPTASNQNVTFNTFPSKNRLLGKDCELTLDTRATTSDSTGYYVEITSGSTTVSAPLTANLASIRKSTVFVPCSTVAGSSTNGPTIAIKNSSFPITPLIVDNIEYGEIRSAKQQLQLESVFASAQGTTWSGTANTWVKIPLSLSSDPVKYPFNSQCLTVRNSGRYRITIQTQPVGANGESFNLAYNVNGGSQIFDSTDMTIDPNASGAYPQKFRVYYAQLVTNDVVCGYSRIMTNTRTMGQGRLELTQIEGASGTVLDTQCSSDVSCANEFSFESSITGVTTFLTPGGWTVSCSYSAPTYTCSTTGLGLTVIPRVEVQGFSAGGAGVDCTTSSISLTGFTFYCYTAAGGTTNAITFVTITKRGADFVVKKDIKGHLTDINQYTRFTNYTPTIVGCASVSDLVAKYREDKDTIHIHGEFACNTPNGSTASFSLPSGYTTRSYAAGTVVGWAGTQVGGTPVWPIVSAGANTSIKFGFTISGNTPLTPQPGNLLLNNTNRFTFDAFVEK